ncbi:hypothetical protein EI533_24805 [Pseudomonas donghuensis]|uniref:hypothetical protein n=1 Tax=Pseudomonas donghuensis TaxID=1163398 RepID=UPI00215DEE13|nr:hypothetical protein [Pseudomonas donghuensis]MBF4210932.1 hypothetical protein [Pseudomonas donghuensis]UVL22495.1 hypothetical protein LOY30_16710 [Pseudomonas donghuensis]
MKQFCIYIFLTLFVCSCSSNNLPLKGEIVFGADISKPVPVEVARLNYPEDAIEAEDGTIYVTDTQLHVIRRIKNGIVDNFAGTFSRGFNGDAMRSNTMLDTPTGLLLSPDKKSLFVADSGNGLIRKIDINTGAVKTIAGVAGNVMKLPVDGGIFGDEPIGYVSSLKYNNHGDLCFQSSEMSIENTAIDGGIYCEGLPGKVVKQKITAPFKLHGVRDFLITESGIDFLRDFHLYRYSKDGAFNSVTLGSNHGKGIVEDGSDIIIGSHTIAYRVTPDMTLHKVMDGFANISNIKKSRDGLIIVDSDQGALFSAKGYEKKQITGWSPDAIGALTSVAKYGDDKLLILDNQRPRIFLFDTKTGVSSLWAGTGNQGWASINIDKLETSFYYPTSIASDSDLNVYIAEQHRIMKIDKFGQVTRYAGYEKDGDIDSDNPEEARFRSIGGMSIGPDNALYISDTYNSKIRRIDRNGKVTTVAGTGKSGDSVISVPALDRELNHPLGVLALENGNVLITDSWNNTVLEVEKTGVTRRYAGKPLQSMYQGMGSLSGDNGDSIAAGLNTPSSLAKDKSGNIYISDQFNHRIRMVAKDGSITTIAGSEQGYAPNGAKLNFPNGSEVIDGFLYVADSGNRLIVRYKVD